METAKKTVALGATLAKYQTYTIHTLTKLRGLEGQVRKLQLRVDFLYKENMRQSRELSKSGLASSAAIASVPLPGRCKYCSAWRDYVALAATLKQQCGAGLPLAGGGENVLLGAPKPVPQLQGSSIRFCLKSSLQLRSRRVAAAAGRGSQGDRPPSTFWHDIILC